MTLDARLLHALRQAGPDSVAGTDLAHRLGISRSTLVAHIEELRRLGYEIEASPHHGYRLRSAPDVLHADDLLSLVQGSRLVGRDIRVFQETTSTNDVADKLGRDGAGEGVVVFAETQTRGRGRLGRGWHSPAGKGLWFSVLLRPDLRPQSATQLTVAAATALVRAIREVTSVRPEIKWPNDLVVGGRKLAGVLTELSAELDHINHLILGIGVDVNLTAGDLPADLRKHTTSLRLVTGRVWRRADLAAAILRALDHDYGRICQGRFGELAEEWETGCTTLGRRVRIQVGERMLAGRAEALDEDGALLLRTDHGHLERIIGGDVRVDK